MKKLARLLQPYLIRRAHRHYDRAITQPDAAIAEREPTPAQQRDIDLAVIWQIWDHTLNHEMGAGQ